MSEELRQDLSAEDLAWAEDTFSKLSEKLGAEVSRMGAKIPYIAEDGVYKEDNHAA